MPDAEEASSFLKGVTRDADALYDHLTKVLLKIVKDGPQDAFDAFENLSVQVKAETAGAAALNQGDEPEAEGKDDPETLAQMAGAAQATLDLILPPKKKKSGDDEEEEEEEEEPEKAPIPNVMNELGLLRHVGIGLDEEEVYRLMLSMQTLTTKNELQNVRFWGKILGTKTDYYIVEAKQEEYPEPEEGNEAPPKQEPMGSGCNECIYYATTSPEEPWTKLNPVQPEHIVAARAMRRYLTGDLSAPVLGFPRFPWGEGAYLRTQIARISADTVLCPKGQFTVEGEEDEEQTVADNEEWGGIDNLVQDSDSNWLHNRPGIMSEGRSTPWADPDKEEEEEEEEEEMSEEKKAALAAIEKPRKKLCPIKEDKMGKSEEKCWTFRTAPNKFDKNAVSSALSLQWPGALSLARNKTVLNFYMGWGLPLSNVAYQPPNPPAFASEFSMPAAAPDAEAPALVEETDVLPPDGVSIEEPKEEDEDDDDDEEEEKAGEGEGEGDGDEE